MSDSNGFTRWEFLAQLPPPWGAPPPGPSPFRQLVILHAHQRHIGAWQDRAHQWVNNAHTARTPRDLQGIRGDLLIVNLVPPQWRDDDKIRRELALLALGGSTTIKHWTDFS